MFRRRFGGCQAGFGFPRIRGDVPLKQLQRQVESAFSPHTRGCSASQELREWLTTVFPAYAGMFRRPHFSLFTFISFPRIRGDVPNQSFVPTNHTWFSPHTRGCSVGDSVAVKSTIVFPAYAGMFLRQPQQPWQGGSFPRIRGDVPLASASCSAAFLFSPHTRGCSEKIAYQVDGFTVFPAYAGMFRKESVMTKRHIGFPRIRGDVPPGKAWA